MSVVDGFLFFKDWEKSMRKLTKRDFFDLFWAMYDYQMYGKSFPEFSGKAQIIQSFIEPQLRRRMQNSASGIRGVEKKRELNRSDSDLAQGVSEESGDGEFLPEGETETEAESGEEALEAVLITPFEGPLIGDRSDIDQEKEKNKIADCEESENGRRAPAERAEGDFLEDFEVDRRGGGSHAVEVTEKSGDVAVADPQAKLAYGKHANVLMTANERGLIRATIPDSDAYIDMFSEKLKYKGYSYSDHCEAILRWWEKDSVAYERARAAKNAALAEGEDDPNARYRDMDENFERSMMMLGMGGTPEGV